MFYELDMETVDDMVVQVLIHYLDDIVGEDDEEIRPHLKEVLKFFRGF